MEAIDLIGRQALELETTREQLANAQRQSCLLLGYLAEVALGRLKPHRIEVNMTEKTLQILPEHDAVLPVNDKETANGQCHHATAQTA